MGLLSQSTQSQGLLANNQVNQLPKTAPLLAKQADFLGDTKAIKKGGNDLAMAILKGTVNSGLDVLETPKQVYNTIQGNDAAQQAYTPKQIPGLPGLGNVESHINMTKDYLSQGDNPIKAAGKGLLSLAVDEPFGKVFGAALHAGGLGLGAIKANKVGLLAKDVEQIKPEGSQTVSQLEKKLPQQVELSRSLPSNVPQTFNPDKYVQEQVAKREGVKATDKAGIVGKTKSLLAEAKAKLVDFTAPIEDVLHEHTKKYGTYLKPEDDIHNQIDRVLRSPTLAGQFAKDKGLIDIVKKVDNPDNLDQYLIAKHAKELEAQGIKTGRDSIKDDALIKEFAPTYEPLAKQVSKYSHDILDYSTEAGLIDKKLADHLKTLYPDYVPFNRVFNELEKQTNRGVGGGVASLNKQTAVQKIVGSEREIESPIQSLLAKTNDVFKQGEKNKAAKMLASYKDLKDNPFQLRELGQDEKAAHTVSFFDNGIKRTFETTPEVANAAKALNVQQLSTIGKILALPVRVARVGITGANVPFAAANISKDQVSAFINSEHALKTSIANPNNFVKSLMAAVKHDDLYEEMVRAGGGGTSFDISRNQVEHTVSSIRAGRSIKSRIAYTVKNPSQLLHAVENIIGRSEELTRIQQYRGTKEALLKRGVDEKNATIAAARASRESTVNFARRGEWGTVLNSAILYLGAGIQGTRTLLRNLKTKPIQTATKIALVAFTPMAYATTWNLSDKKRREAYMDISDFEKENNIIIVPKNPVKDFHGKWNVMKIPMSQEINNLTGIVRKGIEQAYGVNPVKFKDFADAFIGTVSPVKPDSKSIVSAAIPQIAKPTAEAVYNKNFFTGNPIVPQGLDKLSPQNQVKKDTSGSARIIGDKLGISPIKVEAWIKSTFGGVGSQAENAVDKVLAKMDKIPQEQVGGQSVLEGITSRFQKASGGQSEQKVYEQMDKAAQEKADYKATKIRPIYDKAQEMKATGDQEGADKLVNNLSDSDYALYKSIKTSEKAKKTAQLERDMTPLVIKASKLKSEGKKEEADSLVKDLTDEEYHAYILAKKKLSTH